MLQPKNLLMYVLFLAVGLAGGYFLCPKINKDCCKGESGHCDSNATQRPTVKAGGPKSAFSQLDPVLAHTYSVQYRNKAGYCKPGGDYSKVGMFEMSYDGATDLLNAMEQIKSNLLGQGFEEPEYYRCIFGLQDPASNKVTLMVVALKSDNRTEYTQTNYMYKGDYSLPCPLLCDISSSSIISGTAPGQTPCK